MLKYLREHLNPEPSVNEGGVGGGEWGGVKKKKSWKMDSLTSKDNK